MPSMKEKKSKAKPKKQRPKQKQKQKQIVKQNVKVNVQSSGGSGGGGSSIPMPTRFMDTTGENVRLQNLVQQLIRQPQQAVVPVAAPMPYNDPVIDYQEAIAKGKLRAMEAEAGNPYFEGDSYRPSNDDVTLDDVFRPSNSNNNNIMENVYNSNLRDRRPKYFEDNQYDIQAGEHGISLGGTLPTELEMGGKYTRKGSIAGSEHSIGSDIQFASAGIQILKKGEEINRLIAERTKKQQEERSAFSQPKFAGEAVAESVAETAPYGYTASGKIRKSPLGSRKKGGE